MDCLLGGAVAGGQPGRSAHPVYCASCNRCMGWLAEMAPRRDYRGLPGGRCRDYRGCVVVRPGTGWDGFRHSGKPAVTKNTSSHTAATAWLIQPCSSRKIREAALLGGMAAPT